MPTINGKRVLKGSPEDLAQNPVNTRGGIDRLSNREATSLVTRGTTGTGANKLQPSISASELVNPTDKVNPPVPQVNTNDGSRTNNLIGSVSTNTQDFITSESENARKRDELAGLLGTQTFDAAEKRAALGESYNLPSNLSRLTDIKTQLTNANTDSDVQKTQIQNAAGQTIGQAQREVTQQDRENAVRTAGLAAEAAVLQGSIETASTLINSAMQDFYSDRTLKNQNMIQQLEYFSGLADQETSQLLQKEQRKYEEDQAKIKDVKDTVNAALTSGAASIEDMRFLTDPNVSDDQRLARSQSIVANAARQSFAMDMAQKSASVRASNAAAALNEAELTAFNKAQEDAAKGILSPDQVKTANELNKDFESQPIVKAYNEGLQKYIVLEDTLANGIDGIQDLQLVYDFMKAVDPTSVVRETEFENAAKTGNIFQGTFARFNKTFGSGGFLPEEVKQDFIRAARASFDAKNNQYFNVKAEYANRINNTIGTNNGADYLTAYEGAAPLTEVDNDIVFGLSGASPEEIQDIMLLTEQIMSNGIQGSTIYK